jgi:diguanylate cyclase (GGDEF)-like protein
MPPTPSPATRSASPALRRRYWRLPLRLVGASLVLLLLVQLAAYAVVDAAVARNTQASLERQLDVGERVWNELLEQRAQRLRQGAAVLARDFGLRDALAVGDRATLEDALANHGGRLEAQLGAVLDPRFEPLAKLVPPGSEALDGLVARAPEMARSGWGVVAVQGRPYQVVIVPAQVGRAALGWVAMGFAIDAPLLRQFHGITGLQATLAGASLPGATPGDAPAWVQGSWPAAEDAARVAAARGPALVLADDTLRLRDVPVGGAGPGAATLRLSASRADAEGPFQQLQALLAGITVLGVLLFGAGSVWLARRITRPLSRLVRAADRLGRGDYDAPVAGTGRQDEVGELATAFEHMREGIRAEMYFDQRLTQLPNRAHFRRELDRAFAEQRPVAVLLVGLDRFKEINRRLGYGQGDRLLQAMARRLQAVVRPGNFVARLGGDQFAVLLPGAGLEDARLAAHRIGAELEQPLDLDGHRVDRSAAIGVALAPLHADSPELLLARAEVALYVAKDRREAIVSYDPAIDRDSEANLALLSELRHALANHELRLYLQPKVHLRTGAIAGAEALLRWEHPQRKLVPPGAFIPYAEDSPLIKDLTLWVFEAVAREQRALREQGITSVSINLSARDLMDLDLPGKLEALLRRHGATSQGLCLETTEGALMSDVDRAQQTLERLREAGFKLSIDDFGVEHSSLARLKDLSVHEVKIDMSFIRGMQADPRVASLVRAMLEMGHALGLSVVAEGVENAELARRLAEMGCDEGQGWHFGKAMPAAELRQWALAHRERQAAAAALA